MLRSTLFLSVSIVAALATSSPVAAQITEFDKLTASDAAGGDWFGGSVAISGNTAIVGASGDDDAGNWSGSAYVFDVTTGEELLKLTASDAAMWDYFGFSVAISGNRAIVGGNENNSAYLFNATTGEELFKLTASDTAYLFGDTVAISGNTAIVGAWGDEYAGEYTGSAYLFDVTTGRELFKLTASDGAMWDRFGYSVAISGNTAIVGADGDSDNAFGAGSAYLFDVTSRVELFELTASDAAAGDSFGNSVAISGNTALVGAYMNDDAGDGSGSAYLFDVTTGEELFKLTASDSAAGDRFGSSVSISGNTAIVGGRKNSAYLFDTTTGEELFKLTASDAAADDLFGRSVAISGKTMIVGASGNDDAGDDSGSAYLFEFPVPQWISESGGAWDAAENWTPGGWFPPDDTTDVFIEPPTGLTVIGPADTTTIRSLTIGAQSGTATLQLQNTGTLSVNQLTTINQRGRITGDGTLNAVGRITNYGEIDLGTNSVQIVGEVLSNHGLIRGSGRIDNTLYNEPDGEVRVQSGQRILFTGTDNWNAGEINLDGGTVEFTHELVNHVGDVITGFISGRGQLRVDGGLTNHATMALSGGLTDVHGDVTNSPGAMIVVSGGSTTTFFDDVHNDGQLRVSSDSRAVFFGDFTGDGGTTGTGTAYLEGDLRPGNSPGEIPFGGDLVFGSNAGLEIELGDSAATPPNDLIAVAGDAHLDGTLTLVPLGKLQLAPLGDPSWYGKQPRTIVTADGLNGIVGEFAHVPETVPQIVTRVNGGQGHLGRGVFLIDGGVVYEEHAVKLELLQAAPGDANGDQEVDFDDIVMLLSSGLWNVTEDPGDPYIWPPTWTEGDFTGDGLVSFADVAALLASGLWNQGIYTDMVPGKSVYTIQDAPGIDAAPSTAVPEPGTVAMLAGSALGLLLWRRRKRQNR